MPKDIEKLEKVENFADAQCLYYAIGEKKALNYMMELCDSIIDVMHKETRKEAEDLAAKHPILKDWDYMSNAVYVLIDNAAKGIK
tara:strand:+ start:1339 stop:1593 length:255 start_codon:yes stop_codon:yes gene_type:complete